MVEAPATPLLSAITERALRRFLARPTHAVLLKGAVGSNFRDIANWIRAELIPDSPPDVATVLVQKNEAGTIPIEAIRALSQRLKLHHAGDSFETVVIIDTADALPTEAQNALLKLLEEPPAGVLFILFSEHQDKVLSTISSRCVGIDILPLSKEEAMRAFPNSSEIAKFHALSGGHAELMQALLTDTAHPFVQSIADAKRILTMTPFERLALVEREYKQRDQAASIISALIKVCHAGLQSGRATERWLANYRACTAARTHLEANVQAKLVLDNLFLNVR